jgi:hypothetical protein
VRWLLASLAGACIVAIALPAAAAADLRFQAEGGSLGPRSVRVVKDRSAGGGRAVLLVGSGTLRKRISSPALIRIRIRARGIACRGRPQLVVRLDDFLAGRARVRSRRWRTYSLRAPVKAGSHVVRIGLANPRRTRSCRRKLMIDSVRLVTAPTITKTPAPPLVQAAAPAPTFTNPVWRNGMADPMVLDVGNRHSDYWAYATGGSFPSLHSKDLVHWEDNGGAMPVRPDWTPASGEYNPWAPSVLQLPGACPAASSGPCFVMYHVGLNTTLDPDSNCVGVATSPSPAGPFTEQGILDDAAHTRDQSDRPIGCGDDSGYSNIDPAPIVAGGNAYLYISTGHRCAAPNPHGSCPFDRAISVIPLSADRLHAAGLRTELFTNDPTPSWEHAVVENPWPVDRGSAWHLLYSGGVFTGQYGMGDSTGPAPTGPLTKYAGNPVLIDGNGVVSAGGGSLVTGPRGGAWVAYHGRPGASPAPRLLRLDPVSFEQGGSVRIDGPSTSPRPVP